MKYHIATGRSIAFEKIAQEAEAGKCPRHAMWDLSQQLGAKIHQPQANPILPQDKLLAKIDGLPERWSQGRVLSTQLGRNDVVFCTGEDSGIPIATHCANQRERPKVAVFAHNLARPRGYMVSKLFRLADRIDLFVVNAQTQYDFLHKRLNIPQDRLYLLPEQTDTKFFTPGAAQSNNPRPIVASVGLEKRDYRTLAAATQDIAVDVKISGFSKDASVLAQTFPEVMPANMSRNFYEWKDLVQLYRNANVVVVSLAENRFCAGLTAMLEAMACRRPVVITRTEGLAAYLTTPGIATIVEPGDADAMRQAILHLLMHPQEAEAQAQRGYKFAIQQHSLENYVAQLSQRLVTLANQDNWQASSPLAASVR